MNETILKITEENDTEKVKTVVSKTKRESIVIMQTIEEFEGYRRDSTSEVILLKNEAIQLANTILESYR